MQYSLDYSSDELLRKRKFRIWLWKRQLSADSSPALLLRRRKWKRRLLLTHTVLTEHWNLRNEIRGEDGKRPPLFITLYRKENFQNVFERKQNLLRTVIVSSFREKL